MKFRIDRRELPYDAFVNDPSWLSPITTEEGDERDGDEGKKADTDGDKGPRGQPGEEKTEYERADAGKGNARLSEVAASGGEGRVESALPEAV